jgi:hypothetical protein
MKVDVRIKNENWKRDLQEAAMNTINKKYDDGKELTEDLFRRYIFSEHSPIRGIELRITLYDIPCSNSVHFARHVHSIPYVSTNRPDRTGKERSVNDTCTHMMDINIQALIDMARKRLCVGKVDKVTYGYMLEIKKELIRKGGYYKIIGECLVPNCIYRGVCPEFKSCGRLDSEELFNRYTVYNLLIGCDK